MSKRKTEHPNLTPQKRRELAAEAEHLDRHEKHELIAWARSEEDRQDVIRQLLAQLRAARLEAGYSLAEVDQRTGIGRSNLSRLENHPQPNPTLDTLLRYAHALGVQLRIHFEPQQRSNSDGRNEHAA